jgi:hypothetical protein
MTELEARIRQILARLELLSEARASSLATKISSGGADTRPPPGVREDPSQVPSRVHSPLIVYYRWAFDNARDDEHRWLLCYLAERDHRNHVKPLSRDRTALFPSRGGSTEDENALVREVLDRFEGMDAQEVAVLGDFRVGWVRTIRERAGRRAEDGTERPTWFRMSEEEKLAAVAEAYAEGAGNQRVASALGVSRRTIARYVAKLERAA